MILDIHTEKKGKNLNLEVSVFNKEGNIEIIKKTIENPKSWRVETDKSKLRNKEVKYNWNGDPAILKDVNYFNKFDILNFIDTQFTEEEKELTSGVYFPNYISLDIETKMIDDFKNLSGKQEITAIALALPKNSLHKSNSVIVMGTKPLTKFEIESSKIMTENYLKEHNFEWTFKYAYFKTEKEMLTKFVNSINKLGSLCIGWNLDGFDYPYLKKRCEVIGVEFKNISPVNKLQKNKVAKPLHFGFYDYLEAYKKYDRFVEIKESEKLDYIANQVLKMTKLKYDGNLDDLYEKDTIKFYAYNAIDAVAVMEIHNKLQTLNTPLMISALNNLSLYKATSFINLTEHLLYREFVNRGFVVADEHKKNTKRSYEGAYVKEPNPGIYKWLACLDFASLYPSIERAFNISPETFVKKTNNKEELEKYRNDKNYIVTSSNAIFRKTETPSVLKKILDDLFFARRHYQSRAKNIKEHLAKYNIII